MKFKRSAPATLITVVIVVVSAVTFLSGRLFGGLTASVEAGQFELMRSILDTSLREAADKALARAELIAALPTTRQLVAEKDRDRLLIEYGAMFQGQKERHGVDQAQFHLPPATSLLRLHNPTTFGDDLARFRPLVVAVNREQVSRKGLAIARGGPGIFGVAPVSDLQGKHVGSFEIGLDFGALLVALKVAYGLELALFVEEKPLREFAAGLNPALLGEQNRFGRFIRLHTTNGALMKELIGDADVAVVSEASTYTRDAGRVPYGVALMPLRDASGQPLGVIAVARDFSGSREAAGRSLIWQICLAVFAIVILAGFIIVVIRGALLRPLGVVVERFMALTSGAATTRLGDSDRFCEEIRPLAELHDRIVARRAQERGA